MSFSAVERRLLRLRTRRGGSLASYFGGDSAATEAAVADLLSAIGNSGRSGVAAALELLSDYLQATGAVAGVVQQPVFVPTHYVSATATGSGNGSLANPFTLAQACALAQPGWRVLIRAGTYIGVNRGSRFAASFQIASSGTEANPIIFFAENYAALSTTGRVILQHNGTSRGTGCPVLGLGNGHHWYGVYINEDQAPTTADTGPVVCTGANNRISYARINRGTAGPWSPINDNNCGAIRFEFSGCRNNVVSDCWIENYAGTNSGGRSEQGIQVYGAEVGGAISVGALTIENNFFDNCQYALTIKSISGRLIQGGIVFRRNIVAPSNFNVEGDPQTGAINFIGVGNALGRSQVYQNIQVGGSHFVACSQQVYPVLDVDVVNNTCINLLAGSETVGVLCTRGDNPGPAAQGSGWRLHNNLKTGGALFRKFRYDDADTALLSCTHNLSNGNSGGRWAEHSDVAARAGLVSLAQWVAGTAWDDNSLEANPLLVSSTLGSPDLGKLQSGSPARSAGVDILNLLGGGTGGPINIGAYITAADVIGIRPLA